MASAVTGPSGAAALAEIRGFHAELTAIRRDLHRRPELGLDTPGTAETVARHLESLGIEVHRGVGGHGVVGVLRGGRSNRSVGLRADMDALPIQEDTGADWASEVPGRMHACGHDGHTAMLLGAARYLAESGAFDGTVNLIFQPGEEGHGGALKMLEDGLFTRFPCDSVFALHTDPGLGIGQFRVDPGTVAAGGGFFDIVVRGHGSHAASPDRSVDPVLVAAHVVTALQAILSRNLTPTEAAVISVTRIEGGDAYNVIPETARIGGTARYFTDAVGEMLQRNIARTAEGVAAAFGARAETEFRFLFAPLVNDPAMTAEMRAVAEGLAGAGAVGSQGAPSLGSEDFSFMSRAVPGACMLIGNGDSAQLHHPAFDFDDAALPHGAALLAGLARRMTSAG